jgi:hypothetical protein
VVVALEVVLVEEEEQVEDQAMEVALVQVEV